VATSRPGNFGPPFSAESLDREQGVSGLPAQPETIRFKGVEEKAAKI
jgi:hypothetical protein